MGFIVFLEGGFFFFGLFCFVDVDGFVRVLFSGVSFLVVETLLFVVFKIERR